MSQRKLAKRIFKRNSAVVALGVIVLMTLVALFAPVLANEKPILLTYQGVTYYPAVRDLFSVGLHPDLAKKGILATSTFLEKARQEDGTRIVTPPIPYGPKTSRLSHRYKGPGEHGHLLGTDDTGRDVASRLIHGARVSLSIGLVAMSISFVLGILVGSLCGWYGGWLDILLSRIMEIIESIPLLLLLLILLAAMDRPNLYMTMTIIGLTGWTGIARIFRGQVFKVRSMDYVSAARAMGSRLSFILLKHILPNAIAPVFVALTFGVASAILTESMLSFLGFSDPTFATWGEIVEQGRKHTDSKHLIIFPGVAIFTTVTAFNLLGDALRDAIDPRMSMK